MKNRSFLFVILFCLYPLMQTYAQTDVRDLYMKRIANIYVEGVPKEMQSDIMKLIPIKKGDDLSPKAIRRSIKLIYKVYDIDNIEVYLRPGASGVEVVFKILASVFIKDIKVFGNDSVSSLNIIEAIGFNKMSIYSKTAETDYIEKLSQYLYSRGFRRSVVKTYTEKTDLVNAINLFIIIEENERTTIANSEVVGKDERLKGIISHSLAIEEGRPLDLIDIKRRRKRLVKRLKRQGRIFINISEPQVRYNPQTNTADLSIHIENERIVHTLVRGNRTMPLRLIREKMLNILDVQEKIDTDVIKYDLTEFYKSYGYFFADIKVDVKRRANYDLLVIEITEGEQVRIKGFEFVGNNRFSDTILKEVIQTYIEDTFPQESVFEQVKYQEMEYGLLASITADGRGDRRRYTIEKDRTALLVGEYLRSSLALENYYKSNGFINVQIGEVELLFNKERDGVILKYSISEGVETVVRKISFENNRSLSNFILMMNARSLRNRPLNYLEVENAALAIRRLYENEGFYFVEVDYVVDFSDDRKDASLRFIIEENPKTYIKRIIPQGNYITNDSVVLSNLFIREKGLLRQSDLVSSQARLMRLSVFRDASLSVLEPEIVQAEKDILVEVRENEPRYIEYSLGLSTEDGIRTAFLFNHLNLMRSALEFNSRLMLSYQIFMYIPGYLDDSVAEAYKNLPLAEAMSRQINLGLNYPKVYGIPLMASTRLDIINERVNQRAYYMDRTAVSPSFEAETLPHLSVYLQLSLDYKYLQRTPAVIPQTALSYSEQQALKTPLGSNILGSIKPTLTYDRRDDKFNPHRGYYLTLGTEYVQNLGRKTVSLIKLNSLNTIYIPVSRKSTFALQIAGGNIFSLDVASQTPSDMFFYLGGRGTLRGIREGALWPEDIAAESKSEGGEVRLSPGGNAYLLYKLEFRFPIIRGFDGGIFVDAGNLWIRPDNLSPLGVRATSGFGIRYRTPVGPIALDMGFNLMPDEVISEPLIAWHFSVGLF